MIVLPNINIRSPNFDKGTCLFPVPPETASAAELCGTLKTQLLSHNNLFLVPPIIQYNRDLLADSLILTNFPPGIHSKNITGSWIPRHTISQPSSSQLPIIKEKGPHLSGYLSTRSSAQAEPPLSVNTFRNYVFTYNPRTLPAATIPSSTRPIQVVK